jgi:hypothetical protein
MLTSGTASTGSKKGSTPRRTSRRCAISASGDTVAEAIEAAEREVAERRADYERRKAAGLLTDWELLNERVAQIWAPEWIKTVSTPTVLAGFVNRSFEKDVQTGKTIQINTHKYEASE